MAVQPVPDGYHTVTPYMVLPDVEQALEFVQRAFGAKVVEAQAGADGKVRHADVLVGDSHVMFGRASEQHPASTATLYLYVPNTDELYQNAIAAGATSLREPTDEFYGDRSAGVLDAQGNRWWMATHIEDVSPEEMDRRAKAQWK